MKKQDLLPMIDDALLEKLVGFCYTRTHDSYEAEELCSEILLALVKAAHQQGEIGELMPFIWKIARNVYADFSKQRRQYSDRMYDGDAEEILPFIAQEIPEDDTDEQLNAIYRRMAFLTRSYREVMILHYLEGMPTAEIAERQGISQTAVRQRLFAARNKIRNEVDEMTKMHTKPVALDKIELRQWGTGNPEWGNPFDVCERQLSYHVIWLCRKKPMSATEIAEQLNVPTLYIEEELEILTRGANGEYGLLRKTDGGKYIINFVLLDAETMKQVNDLYMEHLPAIADTVTNFIIANESAYLKFPYLNKKVDLNLILWQQIYKIGDAFADVVETYLLKHHFADVTPTERPFTSFAYVGESYGGGHDGISAMDICGYREVLASNIYIGRIREHFHCSHNISRDPELQLAIRAIDGMKVDSLSEAEKEHAAKAVDVGYLYRDGDMLYTKILVSSMKDRKRIFDISCQLCEGYFEKDAAKVADKLAVLIRKAVPAHLLGEWRFANRLAALPILDALVEILIDKGVLTPPKDGIGAEGCWMFVDQ